MREDLVQEQILVFSNSLGAHLDIVMLNTYCGFITQLCRSACSDNYHQIGLRCYGKSINNIINTVYAYIYIIPYTHEGRLV